MILQWRCYLKTQICGFVSGRHSIDDELRTMLLFLLSKNLVKMSPLWIEKHSGIMRMTVVFSVLKQSNECQAVVV